MLKQTGLVLEGGGMRGVYTAGVLEYFLEQQLFFPYVIGVSAGACNAASYLSRQQGRNKKVNIEYINHPNYLSYKNLWRKRQLFDMDFIFHELPTKYVPFDFDAYRSGAERFVVGTTDCKTGQLVYFEKQETENKVLTLLKASSSLPFVAPIMEFCGKKLLDGGISDPIPVRKALNDGCEKAVIILTRNQGYEKKKSKVGWAVTRAYCQYPQLAEQMLKRYEVYNETIQYIEAKEKEGKLFVIRPTEPLQVGRIEKDQQKLEQLYNQGYLDTQRQYEDILKFLA